MTSKSVLFNETHIKQANKRNYKLRTRDQNHITIYLVFLDEVQLDLRIQTRLYQNPCYFELKTLSHGFAFQTFPISYFKLWIISNYFGFPPQVKNSGVELHITSILQGYTHYEMTS